MTTTLRTLLTKGRTAAERWRECDDALTSLQDTFGDPYEDARNVLNDKLLLAEGEGFDLRSNFQGKENSLKFPDLNTQIIVRIHSTASEHQELKSIQDRIESKEKELKVLKAKLKAKTAELTINEKIVNHVQKVTTAFKSLG